MLGTIFTIIGLVIIIASLAGYIVPKVMTEVRRKDLISTRRYQGNDSVIEKSEYAVKGLPLIAAIILFGLGIVTMFAQGAVYYAEPGYSYLVQYPTGTQVGETSPGYHFKYWGTAEPFKKFITVAADSNPSNDANVSAAIGPIEGRFTDAVLATIEVTTRFQLPVEEAKFKKMALAFRTQDNLESSTLVPVLKEVVRNSARTMTAQDYIAGKGGEFENSILDQMQLGTYILDIREKRPEGKQDIAQEGDRGIDNSQMVKYEVRKMRDPKTGEILRKPTALIEYGIIVAQSNVSAVDPEKKFKEMLGKQRDAAAEASVKKQEAKRAEYDKQKIIAEGETAKAAIRIEQEKAQITKLIAAETARKEAEIALAEAKIQKEREKELAAKKKIAADAIAYEKTKVLKADGALEMKLDALVKMNKDNANALAKRAVPTNYFAGGGGGGKGGSDSYDAEMVRQLRIMNINAMKTLKVDTTITK